MSLYNMRNFFNNIYRGIFKIGVVKVEYTELRELHTE